MVLYLLRFMKIKIFIQSFRSTLAYKITIFLAEFICLSDSFVFRFSFSMSFETKNHKRTIVHIRDK